MLLDGPLELAGRLELLERVLADRLEHPEARLAVGVFAQPQQQALLDQRVEVFEHVGRAVGVADRGRGLEPQAADEHAQAPEQRLLPLEQQVVAPGDRVAQRPLALVGVLRAAGQQGQPLVEPAQERLRRERPHARRRQLDRERQAVEPPADRGDRIGVLVGQLEVRPRRCGRARRRARPTRPAPAAGRDRPVRR